METNSDNLPIQPANDKRHISLPTSASGLCLSARELRAALREGKADDSGRITVGAQTIPPTTVSKGCIDKAARALHAIVTELESRGLGYKRARSKYDKAYFEKDRSRLQLSIEEPIATIKREPTAQEKRRPSWEWRTHTQEPSGFLVFSISPDPGYGYRSTKSQKWAESEVSSLDTTVADVVEGIWQHYLDLEKERKEQEEKYLKYLEEQKAQDSLEKKLAHERAIDEVARTRAEDLLRAGEWWRIHRVTNEFIDACETKWTTANPGGLSPEQLEWLTWARATVEDMSPFATNYPDPIHDGNFDATTIPLGGPYPSKRGFPRPPTMPKIPNPVQQSSGYQPIPSEPKPYPFWLKHQHR